MPYCFLVFISSGFKIILKFFDSLKCEKQLSNYCVNLLNDFRKFEAYMSQFGHTFALVLSQIIAKFIFIDFSAMKLS